MAGATLSLNRSRVEPVPSAPVPSAPVAEKPRFNPHEHYGEVGGVEGVKYVQGKHFFKPNGDFHSVAPEAAQLAPLTSEQEADRQKRLRANKKFFGKALAQAADSMLPQKVIDAERENAKARSAETLAE